MIIMSQGISVIHLFNLKNLLGKIYGDTEELSVLHREFKLTRNRVGIQIQARWLVRPISQNFPLLYTYSFQKVTKTLYEHLSILVILIHKLCNLQSFHSIQWVHTFTLFTSYSEKKKNPYMKGVREKNKQTYRDLQAASNLEIEFQV